MAVKSLIRQKYLRMLIVTVAIFGFMGLMVNNSNSQSGTWIYSHPVLVNSNLTSPGFLNRSEQFGNRRITREAGLNNVETNNSVKTPQGLISRLEPGVSGSSGKDILIPHIIHQTWDSLTVPQYFAKWIKTWTKLHPDWEYWFWTPKEVRRLIQIVRPSFLKDYNHYRVNLYRANSMRYYIMYYFGGVYADLDLEALRPLDNWTYSHHCILPEETYAHPFLMNRMKRANTMITLLACRPHHPYFKLTIDNLGVYPKLSSGQKLLYVDNMYLKFKKSPSAHEQPDNEVHLAHPDYFLPTFDPTLTSKFKGMCTSRYHRTKFNKQQVDVCNELRAENFRNRPKNISYTNHHWTHVVARSEAWKRKNNVQITEIVPNVKDINKVLDELQAVIKKQAEEIVKSTDKPVAKIGR